MLFIVITAVLVAFSYEPPSDASRITPAGIALAGLVASVVINWLFAELSARWAVRRMSLSLDGHAPIMARYQHLRWIQAGLLVAGYTAVIHGFDWPGVIRVTWGMERWVLIDDLLVLLPIVLSLGLGALAHFRVEELMRAQLESPELHPPRWHSRWNHIDFQLRHHLGIVLVPLLVLVTIQDVVTLFFEGTAVQSAVEIGAAIAGLASVLTFAPFLLRLLWRAEPLPAGILRTRLERLSRRLHFRASDILVWNTHGAVINAAVAGILPWPRYVLLSDALLTHLSEEEVEAVFGHEVGHVRHNHLWFFIAFMIGSMSFLVVMAPTMTHLVEGLFGEVAASQVFAVAPRLILPMTCLGLYFGLFFGFLSRRFERQADIFGCRAVSFCGSDATVLEAIGKSDRRDPPLQPEGIQVFVQALERIADLNGAMRDARSWRHFSIAKRVEFLKALITRPELERSFQRVVFLLKVLVVVALLAGTWYAWQQWPELSALESRL